MWDVLWYNRLIFVGGSFGRRYLARYRSFMKSFYIKNLTLSALFLAMGFLLPMLTGQIPYIGKMLLPMHIPVFLCAMICGGRYSGAVGFVLPLARSLIFSVPVMYPTAIAVAFEMAAYGIVTGFLFKRTAMGYLMSVYISMAAAMVTGRIIRCIAEIILLRMKGNDFALSIFIKGTLLNAIPGIALQLILIPAIMVALKKWVTENRASAQRGGF